MEHNFRLEPGTVNALTEIQRLGLFCHSDHALAIKRTLPPRKSEEEEGGTLSLQPSSPGCPLRKGTEPSPGFHIPTRILPLLPSPGDLAVGWKDGPLWEGQGPECAGACGAKAANLALSPRFCSHTPIHTHAHIHALIWADDHTRGECITLTEARTGSQKLPLPQVSGSLPHHCQDLHGNGGALLTVGGAKRHIQSCVGQPGWVPSPPPCRPQERGPPLHGLDDSTLLPLEGGAGGWPGQQKLLLMNQAVQQVLLAVVVINLQECQSGDRQPGQPGGPESKLHGRQSSVRGCGSLPRMLSPHLLTSSL